MTTAAKPQTDFFYDPTLEGGFVGFWHDYFRSPAEYHVGYTARDCRVCGQTVRGKTLAKVSHLRKHVRQGIILERQGVGALFELRDVDFADRARDGRLTESDINPLPWKQALDYIAWANPRVEVVVIGEGAK
jgi:hypothetical protein